MGCDGGTIPRRDEMVKLKKKAEKADKDAELAARWKHCALTSEDLKRPVVSCELGRLYNKEALLLALLDKPALPDLAKHIRSLKDVVELKFTSTPGYKATAADDGYNDTQSSEYVCPVTGLEMSGRYRFAYLRGCGCVFSEKALKEVPSESCHKCGSPFTRFDIVIMNGTEEDIKRQTEEMLEKRQLAKQTKAAKKRRKADIVQCDSSTSRKADIVQCDSSTSIPTSIELSVASSCESSDTKPPFTTEATTCEPSSAVAQPISTDASLEESRDSPPLAKKPKIESESQEPSTKSGAPSKRVSVAQRQSKFRSSSQAGSKLRSGSSVAAVTKWTTKVVDSTFKPAAEDESARKVYKSLFNSSESSKPKRTSNWITYNPYF